MDKAEVQVWYQGLTLEEEKLWFEEKVKSCESGLLRFAYHLSGNMDKARDLVQAFLRAYRVSTVIMPTILSKAGCLLFCLMFIVSVLKKRNFQNLSSGEGTRRWRRNRSLGFSGI